MLTNFLMRLVLYWGGIRFYKTDAHPTQAEFLKTEFKTVNGLRIDFHFYREEAEDLIFIRGKFTTAKFRGYFIEAKFDEGLPDRLKRFNKLKIFIRNKRFRRMSDKALSKVLLNMYLELIKVELSNSPA